MSKHTPGPWVAHPPGTRNRTGASVDTLAGAVPVASCRVYPSTYEARAVAYANARLIAAAPETAAERDRLRKVNAELLEALRLISGLCDDEPADIKARGLSRCCRINEFARAAIAKAEAA